jgi:sigma-B regulation protein RsbU (phosphoserine phosphatase)
MPMKLILRGLTRCHLVSEIPETTSPSEQEFGIDLFKGFLESNHDLKADCFADSLFDELSSWSENPKGEGQQDDITLLAIHFKSDQ